MDDNPEHERRWCRMRSAARNHQTFWYAMYDQTQEGTDEYGNINKQYATYGAPVKTSGNISPAKGEVVSRQFGDDDLYDRVIGPMPINTPIDEYAILWIGVTPELDAQGHLAVDDRGVPLTPHNYIVRKKAPSLPVFGGVMLAVDKVTVT